MASRVRRSGSVRAYGNAMALARVDHIAIIVESLEASVSHYRSLFSVRDQDLFYEREYDAGGQRLQFAFLPLNGVYFELIEPLGPGPLQRFLRDRGGGVHHVALASDDLRVDWTDHNARRQRIGLLSEHPEVDRLGNSFWFLHPSVNFGVLIEIQSAWAKTSAGDMTPIEPTPNWSSLPG